MRILSIIILLFITFSSCKRNYIYEDNMWDRLSRGNGIWILQKREVFDINNEDGSEELVVSEEPNQTKYYFYVKASTVLGAVIENKYMQITLFNESNGTHGSHKAYFISSLGGGAENKRITLENPAGGVAKVYTVLKGGRKTQKWQVIYGTINPRKEIITLKKCNSCTPDILSNTTETTG